MIEDANSRRNDERFVELLGLIQEFRKLDIPTAAYDDFVESGDFSYVAVAALVDLMKLAVHAHLIEKPAARDGAWVRDPAANAGPALSLGPGVSRNGVGSFRWSNMNDL